MVRAVRNIYIYQVVSGREHGPGHEGHQEKAY